MTDSTNVPKPRDPSKKQDGEVRDIDDPTVQDDTASGGAPEEPDDKG
jgi:hypothetical protein